MSNQNLLLSPNLALDLLSKSSPSQLEQFQLKRSRTASSPTEVIYSSSSQQQQQQQKLLMNNSNNKLSNLSHVPCKFYKQGTCTAGANCTFSHSADISSEAAVCKYFVKGNCKFGTKCALLHTMSPYGNVGGSRGSGSVGNGVRSSIPIATNSSNANAILMAQTPPIPTSFLQPSLSYTSSSSSSGNGNTINGRRDPLPLQQHIGSYNHNHSTNTFHNDPFFATSAPSVSLLHQNADLLWRNNQNNSTTLAQQQRSNIISSPNDFAGFVRPSPRETSADSAFLFGSSPFNNRTLARSMNSGSGMDYFSGIGVGNVGGIRGISNGEKHTPGYDLNDAMLPSSLNNDLFTPNELHVRRIREQQQQQQLQQQHQQHYESLPNMSTIANNWATSTSEQHKWRVPFLAKSSETVAINIPNGHSGNSNNNFSNNLQDDQLVVPTAVNSSINNISNSNYICTPSIDDEVQFYMEDDEAVAYDTTTVIATNSHKTATATINNSSTSNYPSLISLPST